jgi:hypothetical protein
MAQMAFFDPSDRYASLDAKKGPLVEIDAVPNWKSATALCGAGQKAGRFNLICAPSCRAWNRPTS